MRIGIDASCWHNNRGFGRFTRELLSEMIKQPRDHQFLVFSDDDDVEDLDELGAEIIKINVRRRVIDAAIAKDQRSISDILSFTRAAHQQKLDLLFYPAVYSWFPTPFGVPSVITFHDAIAEHFPDLVFPGARERVMWNLKCWLAKKSCAKILTVSRSAKSEIIEYLKIPSEKIDVICEGADRVFKKIIDAEILRTTREKYELPLQSRLLCYVGGFAPHKNLSRLIDAFEIAIGDPGCSDLQLVMIGEACGGGYNSNYNELMNKVLAQEKLASRVRFIGYVSDEDLAALYSDALALALPSLSEGFGLPALEAMSCGTPVLASHGGAVMEVAGAAGLSFDPFDVADIAKAITTLATDSSLSQKLRKRAIPETERNTWRQAAELTLDSLESYQQGGSCGS